jgi:hypothetical protein
MRRTRVDSNVEKNLLTAMILSDRFLAAASAILEPSLLKAEPLRIVAEWCINYHQQYKKAPGRDIEPIYHSWAEGAGEQGDMIDAVHDFLAHLSDRYTTAGEMNVPYLLDELSRWVGLRKAERLKDDLSMALSRGDDKAASEAISGYRTLGVGLGQGADLFNDKEAWARAFAEPLEPLITFPGDAGTFLNRALVRDALIGIQAPEKRGKTWWCLELALRGMRSRRKVAYFSVGDLSEGQLLLRMGVRLTGMPLWEDQVCEQRAPRQITRREGEEFPEVAYKSLYPKQAVNAVASLKALDRFRRGCGMKEGLPYLMISTHANSSINVAGVDAILTQWEVERGFIADVVIIDYADILAPEGGGEFRHQVNDTWKALRRLSQQRHALVIAPTQANAGAYETETQSMKNFSEDKRKLAHVTGMIGLNQTPEEKEAQIMRLNWILLREAPFSANRCLLVGQCLPLGRAFCCGTL